MDRLTPKQRSDIMSRVRSKDTAPEWIVRRIVHRLGYRYRLHVKGLPGSPDLVLRRLRRVIFVNGCFFHQHHCGAGAIPKTHTAFWQEKLQRNKDRDAANEARLQLSGWEVLTVWECEMKCPIELESRLRRFLSGADEE